MSDAELDPDYRKSLEAHWKMLEMTQDDDDRLVSATMKAHCQCVTHHKKPAHATIKQKLVAMINRLIGKSQG